MVFHLGGTHARRLELRYQGCHARGIGTGIVADVDMSVELVVDDTGFGLGRTDECQSGCQPYLGETLLEVVLQSDAILDEQHKGVGFEQRRQQRVEQLVVHRLQTHNHHVGLRHVGRRLPRMHLRQQEAPVTGINPQAMFHHIVIIPMQQKVYFLSAARQLGSVIAANGSCSDHCISHDSVAWLMSIEKSLLKNLYREKSRLLYI